MAESTNKISLEKYLEILKLNKAPKSMKQLVKDNYLSNLKSLVTEREFMINKDFYKSQSCKYLYSWKRERVAWSKLYPTDEWKKSHQRTLLSICLNEFKMPRADFKLMLLHFRMVPLDETKKLAEQLLVSAEQARQRWAMIAPYTATMALPQEDYDKLDDLLRSLLTCTRPVTEETVMRMRKLQEFVDPNWKPVVKEDVVVEKPVSLPKRRGKKRKQPSK